MSYSLAYTRHINAIVDHLPSISFFFFTATAPTAIYTLSLHDALPILHPRGRGASGHGGSSAQDRGDLRRRRADPRWRWEDRKSTRLNCSHVAISYAVFCLKKKKINIMLSIKRIEILSQHLFINYSDSV